MARLPQLFEIARTHDLKIISIKDLVAYRMANERIVVREKEVEIQSRYGLLRTIAYRQITSGDVHLAFALGSWSGEAPVLVRVHSISSTGDVLGVLFDEHAVSLQEAMAYISERGAGVLLCMRHSLPDTLMETLDRYATGGIAESAEQRDFGVGAQILRDLGVRQIRLLTNSPRKRVALTGYGLEIVENVSTDAPK